MAYIARISNVKERIVIILNHKIMDIKVFQKEVKEKAAQLSVMFESHNDAIEVIEEIILPMKGEIIESEFWLAVRSELTLNNKVDSIVKQKVFTGKLEGFQINVFENALIEKGKGTMMLHPEDYKTYIEKIKPNEAEAKN